MIYKIPIYKTVQNLIIGSLIQYQYHNYNKKALVLQKHVEKIDNDILDINSYELALIIGCLQHYKCNRKRRIDLLIKKLQKIKKENLYADS